MGQLQELDYIEFLRMITALSDMMPGSRSQKTLEGYARELQRLNGLSLALFSEFCENWFKTQDKFPAYSQILESVSRRLGKVYSDTYRIIDGREYIYCRLFICNGSGAIEMAHPSSHGVIVAACDCLPMKGIKNYKDFLSRGFKITKEYRDEVIEINKIIKKG